MNTLVYWIWLSLSVTPGTDTFRKLINRFGKPEKVFEAEEYEITECIGSKSRDLKAILEKNTEEAENIFNFCDNKGVGILIYSDERFPNSLRQIETPPVLLYYRGVLPDFNKNCLISVVGTRRLTDYGRKNAFIIGQDLAKSGIIIVSGMAIGIDSVTHAGSLSAGGINIAFLGCGIDVCYPKEHLTLARQIVKNGCVITEYPPKTRPEKHNFPVRNRLIAAISSASVVIEGKIKSGSLITARYAKEFGKVVYALPGNVDNKTSEASNLLIQNGAKLIFGADDIIKDFEFVYPGIVNPFKLAEIIEGSADDFLREYKVACVVHSDNIFSSFAEKIKERKNKKRNKNSEKSKEELKNDSDADNSEKAEFSIENLVLDKDAIRIYKKIPLLGECTVDSLADADDKMPVVMKALLKLEMVKAIVMLPGEKVKRNFK